MSIFFKRCKNSGISSLNIYQLYMKYKLSYRVLINKRNKYLFNEYLLKVLSKPISDQMKICRNIKNKNNKNHNYNISDLDKFSEFY